MLRHNRTSLSLSRWQDSRIILTACFRSFLLLRLPTLVVELSGLGVLEVGQGYLGVLDATGAGQVLTDKLAQPETIVQL
jgi:hypothetical protein